MYFDDRYQAGRQLANLMTSLSGQNNAVIALSRGAILVASEIAKKIHTPVYIFTVQDANRNEDNLSTAIMSGGAFSYNTAFSLGEVEHDKDAIRFFSDQRHINDFSQLNHIAGKDGIIPHELLKRHNIILVSDGLESALSLQIATNYLAPLETKKNILATPVASVEAIDKMHILVDQIFCLTTFENFISSNHYYKKNEIPDDLTVVKIMQNIVLNWDN